MNEKSRNSAFRAMALVALGLAALFTGRGWLVVLVPAAMLVWFGARPLLRSSRN